MNKRLISKLMHEQVGGICSSGGYFFRQDFDYVIQGVFFEYVPRGVYMYDFKFPLFDFFGINLLYSDRLSNRPFIGKGEMSEKEIVDYAITSPEVKRNFDADRSMSLKDLLYFLDSGRIANPHAHLIRASTLVLLGESDSASKSLDEVGPLLHPADVADYLNLKNALGEGQGAAESLLEDVRQKNIKKLVAT